MAKTKASVRQVKTNLLHNIPGKDSEGVENNRRATVTQEEIGQRAYALYEARGREDGHALEDWLQAEQELLEERKGKPQFSHSLGEKDLDDVIAAVEAVKVAIQQRQEPKKRRAAAANASPMDAPGSVKNSV